MIEHERLIEACGVRLHELKTSNRKLAKLCLKMTKRVGKYVDRRVPDDGPDWEWDKLSTDLSLLEEHAEHLLEMTQ